ncbi:MAG: sigma-70 family RNA polymerase sigma factor [Phycisphaerales bacterium]|jgi:RNA polymerase sigma-70 factor (ECF subfamily)|nr:sigma-70 family RNA polymerase sigma factor [Phycisphaerales bacterium]
MSEHSGESGQGGVPQAAEVTLLLRRVSAGDASPVSRLLPLVYEELKAMAESHLRQERSGHTLQATALVHEAYLKLVEQRSTDWQNRGHFFAIAAQAMRRILCNHARDRSRQKRGGKRKRVDLSDSIVLADAPEVEFDALDDALVKLGAMDERKVRIVELKFFAGLSIEEIARFLEVSTATVKREWTLAKAWLARELASGRGDADSGASGEDAAE